MSVGLFNAVALAYVLLLHAPATVVPKPGEVEAVASIKIGKKTRMANNRTFNRSYLQSLTKYDLNFCTIKYKNSLPILTIDK
jgi:hypothetical protein